MTLGIMQPYFMPYLGYFQAIAAVDKYILYGNLTFIKDGWMNRNRVLLKNGQVQMISVPLLHKSSDTMIYDIQIDNSKPWQKKFLKTLFLNYKSAPFFEEIYPFIENLLSSQYVTLEELNVCSIRSIASYLDITTEIESNSYKYEKVEQTLDIWETNPQTLSYLVTKPERKVARVIEICRQEGCHDFINAIGGQILYDKKEFAIYDIDLKFVHTNSISYQQNGNEFVPNLSIIDVLMFNGKEGTQELLNEYTLV